MSSANRPSTGVIIQIVLDAATPPAERHAFTTELLARLGPRVHGLAARYGLQLADAEEVVSELVVKVLARRLGPHLPGEGGFGAYLAACARNAVVQMVRVRARHRGADVGVGDSDAGRRLDREPDVVADEFCTALSDIVDDETRALFRAACEEAISPLTPADSEVIHRYLAGQKPSLIAEELGDKPSRVSKLVHRWRNRVRQLLGDRGGLSAPNEGGGP